MSSPGPEELGVGSVTSPDLPGGDGSISGFAGGVDGPTVEMALPPSPPTARQPAPGGAAPASPSPGRSVPLTPVAEGGGYPCDPRDGHLFIPGYGPVRRAGVFSRLAARAIDLFVVVLIVGVIGAILELAWYGVGGSGGDLTLESVTSGLLALDFVLPMAALLSLFAFGYETVMIGRYGATVGKTIAGVRVVRLADGKPPGVVAAYLRVLVPAGGLLLCGFGTLFVYLAALTGGSPARQGLHDRVAGTMVIRAV